MATKLVGYIFLLIMLCHGTLYAAPRGHLEFTVGAAMTSYKETHDLQPTLDTKFKQYAPNTRLSGNYMLFPNWLYTGFNGQYLGPVLTSSEGESFSLLNYDVHAGWRIPSRPFHLIIEAQYFSSKMITTSDRFGHEDLAGTRFMGIADLNIPTTKMNLYVKVPLWTEYERLRQFYAGLALRLSEREEKGIPTSYMRGTILGFEYSSTSISTTEPRLVKVKYETYALSVGYNW